MPSQTRPLKWDRASIYMHSASNVSFSVPFQYLLSFSPRSTLVSHFFSWMRNLFLLLPLWRCWWFIFTCRLLCFMNLLSTLILTVLKHATIWEWYTRIGTTLIKQWNVIRQLSCVFFFIWVGRGDLYFIQIAIACFTDGFVNQTKLFSVIKQSRSSLHCSGEHWLISASVCVALLCPVDCRD